jgi:hypothetical protein
LSRLARQIGCTPQFVRLVYWGERQSRDGAIEQALEKIRWLRSQRGVLRRIARQTGCTPEFVRLVYWEQRRSRDGAIEQALREHGAIIKLARRGVNV